MEIPSVNDFETPEAHSDWLGQPAQEEALPASSLCGPTQSVKKKINERTYKQLNNVKIKNEKLKFKIVIVNLLWGAFGGMSVSITLF